MRDYEYVTARAFEYYEPTDLDEALQLLEAHGPDGARVFAGGQSLLVLMRRRAVNPHALIDVKRLPELQGISERAGGLELRAATTLDELATSGLVRGALPRLADVAAQMGSVHILNRGTVGGAICQADPAFDLTPALAALDARAVIRSVRGTRELAVEQVASGVRETQLEADELLTAVIVPPQPGSATFGFSNFRRRGGDYPLAQAGVRLTFGDGDAIEDARIVVGGAGPVPAHVTSVEELLRDAALDYHVAAEAAALAERHAKPIGDVRGGSEWRSALVGTVVKRALQEAAERVDR